MGSAILPVHFDLGITRRRVFVLMHLVGDVHTAKAFARPFELAVYEAFRDLQAGDMLAGPGIDVGR